MQKILTTSAAIATILALASPAFADGDAKKGAKIFKKCKACHSITSPDGDKIQRGGRTGPDLYGVIGRQAGTYEGFKYSKVMIESGEKGLVWNQEELTAYLPDPTKYLDEMSDDSGRSKMTFKLRKGGEDVAAYLATFSPEPADDEAKSDDSDSGDSN
ncbi:c-type cytochrome [Aquicoccus sp. G2-2]|uniref:c-type cytochrome n=1 Tax=Aquicoccus sp. G2-2 TaxID=3092120 RepID=UPI002ADF4A29|nr:c-type cytochrome [Aquicoccus sp. G2-2]MEA1114238.1 c-type cytochrome [Aquicoccus sp. G2-2]